MPSKPQKPYSFLGGNFCQKRYLFLRILLKIIGLFLEILDGKHPNFEHFGKIDPCLKVFPLKSGPMSKDFLWKTTYLGGTSPYSLYT